MVAQGPLAKQTSHYAFNHSSHTALNIFILLNISVLLRGQMFPRTLRLSTWRASRDRQDNVMPYALLTVQHPFTIRDLWPVEDCMIHQSLLCNTGDKRKET